MLLKEIGRYPHAATTVRVFDRSAQHPHSPLKRAVFRPWRVYGRLWPLGKLR